MINMKHHAALKLVFLFVLTSGILRQISAENPRVDSLKQLLQQANPDTTRIKILLDLSTAFYQNDPKIAIQYAHDARFLSQKTNYQTGMVRSLIEMTKNFIILYQIDSAMFYSSRAYEIASDNNMIKYAAIAARYQGATSKLEENYPEALAFFQTSESLAVQINDSILLGTVYREIGSVYLNKGLYETSLKYLLRSLDIRLKTKNQVAATLSDLGYVNMELKRYDKALDYQQQVLDLYMKTGDLHALAYSYSDLGILYAEMKDYENALECHKNSLHNALKAKHFLSAGIANINLAEIYGEIGRFNEGIDNITEAFKNFESGGDYPNGELMANMILANIYLKMKRPEMAEQLLPFIDSARKSTGDANTSLSYFTLVSQLSEAKNDFEKALLYYEKFDHLSDSLEKLNNYRQIEDIQTKYETEKKEIENETLKKDNALKNSLLKRQYIINLSTAIIAFLCLVIAFVFFRFQKRQKSANKLLAMKNEEIITQAEELQAQNEQLVSLDLFKENVTMMLVHDLKNPLNTIIGLVKDVVVTAAARKMLILVQNILDVQKFDDAKMKLNIGEVNAKLLANSSISDVIVLSETKDIKIENLIPDTMVLKADIELINRVLVNLLTNAIKFSQHADKIILSQCIGNNKIPDGFAGIQVTDHGQGIPEDQIPGLFFRFRQIEARASGKSVSTGLGLAFCKMAVEAHGGKIGVHSKPGQGSTFWFYLPGGQNKDDVTESLGSTNLPIIESHQYRLNPEHVGYLQPFCNKLKEYEVYEYSNIKKVLEAITSDDIQIKNWKNKLNAAFTTCNEVVYKEIVKLESHG